MSDLKQQLFIASVDAFMLCIIAGLFGGACLAHDSYLMGAFFVVCSALNVRNASIRWRLFSEADDE